MSNKTLGSILIVMGTAIGAGMLATPIVSAAAGFSHAAILMISLWALMCITALLTAEASLAFPVGHNGFISIAKTTLGPIGQGVCWLAFLGLLYALNAAYISGGGSILSTSLYTFLDIELPQWISCLIFLGVFGSFIFWGAHSVDMVNRVLMSMKGIIFIFTMSLVTPYVNFSQLVSPSGGELYLLAAVPILITSFGFHVVVPSLVSYNQNNVSAINKAIVIGSFIPLVIYLLWLAGVLGIVPLVGDMSFTQVLQDAIAEKKDDVGTLLLTMSYIVQNSWLSAGMNFFGHIAITTSFLGVGLGLFDFLLDARKDRSSSTRVQSILLAFIPPLAFALYYPQGFRLALGFAGIFVAITCIILPALFVWRIRQNKNAKVAFRVPGGTPLLLAVVLCGVVVIACEVMDKLKWLPTLASTLIQ